MVCQAARRKRHARGDEQSEGRESADVSDRVAKPDDYRLLSIAERGHFVTGKNRKYYFWYPVCRMRLTKVF